MLGTFGKTMEKGEGKKGKVWASSMGIKTGLLTGETLFPLRTLHLRALGPSTSLGRR